MRTVFIISILVITLFLVNGCNTPTPETIDSTGTLNLQITDAKPETLNITALEVIISNIQVHTAGGNLELVCTNETVIEEICNNDTTICENVSQLVETCENVTDEAGWSTVVEGPVTYDLIQIKDVKEFLGSKEFEAGKYTQIRLSVDSAKLFLSGEEASLTIPSEKIKLVKNFDIVANQTTTLTLDFDAEKSVHKAGENYIMRPTIKVIQE